MLSVVVPVLNEADNICPLVGEIRAALEGRLEYEIVYVDDGSDDTSLAVLRDLMTTEPHLRVVQHQKRCGQSAGMRTGARFARFDWVVTLDGDGQNDPADIPKLWDAMPKNADGNRPWMAIGHRVNPKDTWAKRLASRFANGLRAWLLKDATPDTGCGLKLFPRQVFLDMPWFSHIHRYLPAMIRRAGGESVSVPVNHRPRTLGTSKYGVFDRAWVGIWDLIGVMWLQRRNAVPTAKEIQREKQNV